MNKPVSQIIRENRRPEPMRIERQLVLSQFFGAVMSGLYAHGDHFQKSPEQLSDLAWMQATLMLRDFDRRMEL